MAAHTTGGLLQAARERLAGSPRERLGEWAANRRILGIGRAPRIVPVTDAWHIGALLIGEDRVFATGEVLRARHDAIRGYTAEAQRARSERAAAAFRGGFAEGEVLHLGWTEMDAAAVDRGEGSGILSLQGGVPHIAWSHTGPPRPLADYLDDMLSLR
ncbi:glutaminase [Microbacterium aquilitoris]|uniref:glutaminase n=1 Tax=Microbacterium aquilitoris TaxID=3067307 RepID=UPI000E22E307|nr:glutaminase [Microbacterium sp. KSW2-22]MDT3345614.1 glutaminase [Microbacterium sp. KSW2-22]